MSNFIDSASSFGDPASTSASTASTAQQQAPYKTSRAAWMAVFIAATIAALVAAVFVPGGVILSMLRWIFVGEAIVLPLVMLAGSFVCMYEGLRLRSGLDIVTGSTLMLAAVGLIGWVVRALITHGIQGIAG